jgi:maltose alpha-D-glucosyltransferase/alpha-amylase
MIDDLWYKNAIIYCMDVEKYIDADGDGVGDFEGLTRKLDYLAGLGVTCVWLQPFYPSPNRDNGYDVSDYFGIHPKHGTLGQYVEFMNHAQQLGIRVIVDLVVNHTSVKHPWFQAARKDPASPYRDYYVWSKKRPADHDQGMVFPGVQKTTWTRDPVAGEYYFHRFYDFQPDLNTMNPKVQEEILRVMGFWLQLGVSGFRMDAVPFLISAKGADVKPKMDFELLHRMRDFLQWRRRDAILLAEANVLPRESLDYFGEGGDRLQMMLNFAVNQRLFYALATADIKPLVKALKDTYKRPPAAQWVNFLRSHDELDLGRLTDAQRQKVFDAFAPTKDMQLYNRGVRRQCSTTIAPCWSSRSACCSRSPARRCCSTVTRSGSATTCRCRSASARARRCSGPGNRTAASHGRRRRSSRSSRTRSTVTSASTSRPSGATRTRSSTGSSARSGCAASARKSAGATGGSSTRANPGCW